MRRGLSFLLVGLLGAFAGVLSLRLDTVTRGSVGPGQVAVRAQWGEARTQLRLPPLGQISAATHWTPVTLRAEVDQVDIDRLQSLLSLDRPDDRLRKEVAGDLEPLLRAFALRALLTAAIAGALAGALVPRRRWPQAVTGLVGGVVAVGLLLGGAWQSFDADAFREARFEGPVERAPALLASVRRHVDGYADVRKRVEVLGDQVAELYSAASAEGVNTTGTSDEVRILHVSDIHSNPIGLEVTRQLAERFKVHAVLDTGDLTSFGFPIEGRLGDLVQRIPVPYLFVPGNHDSEVNRATLDAVDNVELLDGKVADVRGVKILGIADPTFTPLGEIDPARAAAIKREHAPLVAAAVVTKKPDVLAIHDPKMGAGAHGRVPLILAGHIHKRSVAHRDGTLVLTVGSTGSTGLGSFTVDTGRSYEAAVLRFVDRQLTSVDRIELRGVGGGFRVERDFVTPFDGKPQIAGREPEH